MSDPEAPNETTIEQPAEYDEQVYWLALPLNGATDPRITKREPAAKQGEFTLRLVLEVPKMEKRLLQTVRVRLPKEYTHLAAIDVAVAAEAESQ